MVDFSVIAIGICVVLGVILFALLEALYYDRNTRSMPKNKDDDDDNKVDLNKED